MNVLFEVACISIIKTIFPSLMFCKCNNVNIRRCYKPYRPTFSSYIALILKGVIYIVSTHKGRGRWLKSVCLRTGEEGRSPRLSRTTQKKCLLFFNSDKYLGKMYIYTYTRIDHNFCFTISLMAFTCKE